MLKSLFQENIKPPKETIIGLSKSYNYRQLFGVFFFLIINAYLLFTSTSKVYTIIFLLTFLYFGYVIYMTIKSNKKEPKIKLKLDEKGIHITNGKFINWSKIEQYEIISKPNYASNYSENYLMIHMKNGKEQIFLNELNISNQKLNYLLKIYKNRSLAK